eukprot:COSAG04_NODE_466_length_13930_cov_50.807968_16_plen_116_part_00
MERHRRLRADLALAEKALERERETQKSRARNLQSSRAVGSVSAVETILILLPWGGRQEMCPGPASWVPEPLIFALVGRVLILLKLQPVRTAVTHRDHPELELPFGSVMPFLRAVD